MASPRITVTWLGHSAFHCAPDQGPEFLIDPWLDNPKAPPQACALAERASVILLTHGHSDHIGGAVELAKRNGATIFASDELATELAADGVDASQLLGGNKGGDVPHAGMTLTLTQAMHSSSRVGTDKRARSIGEPCGVIIGLTNGMVLYDTGDTGVFGDMALLAELYRPEVLLLPIGDFYTMGPRQAAKACELVNPKYIIPHHFGTFPLLTGTPDKLRALLPTNFRDRVINPVPGHAIELS